MAKVQKYFEEFHEAIRTDYDMDEKLREKRDIILDKIRKKLRQKGRPSFKELHQGSYAPDIRTGIKSIEELRYDIDIGLRFQIQESEYTALDVRGWVWEAVEGHTDDVQDKGPCTRVIYADGYHVDLVSYCWWTNNLNLQQYRLAHKTGGWRDANPPRLVDFIKNARRPFGENTEDSATKTDQFRRVVRYLKRWYDERIKKESNAKPSGLAYTLLCESALKPHLDWTGKSDDRAALHSVAHYASSLPGRITVYKPSPEHEDVFGKLSDEQMDKLKERFGKMCEALECANDEPDPVTACKELHKVFGRDFPVPKPENTASRTAAPAVITSSASACIRIHRPWLLCTMPLEPRPRRR